MRPKRIVNTQETRQSIGQAVSERALAVISVRLGDAWVTFKSRFLECDPAAGFFVLDHHETHGIQPPELEVGQQVGVSFRHKSRKIMFASVLEAKGRFLIDGTTSVPALRYRWPDTLIELQRRAYYRTIVPSGVHLRAVLWAGGGDARVERQGEGLSVWCGESIDLSCGGTLVRLGDTPEPTWRDEALLGLELHVPDGRPPIVLDAYFRGSRREESGSVAIATQFVGLEVSPEGRKALSRLSRCVQQFHRNAMVHEPNATRPR